MVSQTRNSDRSFIAGPANRVNARTTHLVTTATAARTRRYDLKTQNKVAGELVRDLTIVAVDGAVYNGLIACGQPIVPTEMSDLNVQTANYLTRVLPSKGKIKIGDQLVTGQTAPTPA